MPQTADFDQFEEGNSSREAALENNRWLFTVERDPEKHFVLYLSGRPNWEYKFIRRAVKQDSDVKLHALIRIAKREAKFEFLGRAGDSSNPLFRGFRDAADEETESYDESVVKAFGVQDGNDLPGGKFPQTAEDLFRYQAVILDDIEAEFLSEDQLRLLERFVSERGGGLLMLGGPESFRHGRWHRTPIKDVLPVYFDRVPEMTTPPESDGSPSAVSVPTNARRLAATMDSTTRIRRGGEGPHPRNGPVPGHQPGQRNQACGTGTGSCDERRRNDHAGPGGSFVRRRARSGHAHW